MATVDKSNRNLLSDTQRSTVAVGICLVSAVVAFAVIHFWPRNAAWAVLYLGCTWSVTSDWLGRRLWLLKLPLGRIPKTFQKGGPRVKMTGLALAMNGSALVLMVVAIIMFFI